MMLITSVSFERQVSKDNIAIKDVPALQRGLKGSYRSLQIKTYQSFRLDATHLPPGTKSSQVQNPPTQNPPGT